VNLYRWVYFFCLSKLHLPPNQYTALIKCFEEDEFEGNRECRKLAEKSAEVLQKEVPLNDNIPQNLQVEEYQNLVECLEGSKSGTDATEHFKCYASFCKNEVRSAETCISQHKGNPNQCSKEILKFVECAGHIHRRGLFPLDN